MVYPRKVRLKEENTNKMISDDKRIKRKGKGSSRNSLTEWSFLCDHFSHKIWEPLPKLAGARSKRKKATVKVVSEESATREKKHQ